MRKSAALALALALLAGPAWADPISDARSAITSSIVTNGGSGAITPPVLSTVLNAIMAAIDEVFLRGSTSVDAYAVGDGTTDDLAGFTAALAAGHDVTISKQYLIDGGDLIIPPNTRLRGKNCTPGGERDGNNYSGIPSTIILNPTHSIILGKASTLECVVILKKGLTTPASTRDQTNLVASFGGNAITVAGDDAVARHVLVLGFANCYISSGYARPVVDDLQGDCTNGLTIDNAHDVAKVHNVEFFPFMTTNTGWNAPSWGVTAAADNGAGVWRLTIPAGTNLSNNDVVWIAGATTGTGMNGRWAVSVVDSTHVDLIGSSLTYTATGNPTSGSDRVDGISAGGTNGLRVGMTVSGAGIPAGTTITYIWGNRIFLSANATATATGVTLTFASSTYVSGDAVLYVNTNRRVGAAFTVTNSETAEFVNCFEYGFDTGFHVGHGALWTQLVNVSLDNYATLSDILTVGMKIDDTASGTNWTGGSVSSYGMPMLVNAVGMNGNHSAQSLTNVVLNPGFGPLPTIFEMDQGRLILSGVKTNFYAGNRMLVGSGNGIGALIISGSDFASTTYVSWDSAAHTATHVDASTVFGTGP